MVEFLKLHCLYFIGWLILVSKLLKLEWIIKIHVYMNEQYFEFVAGMVHFSNGKNIALGMGHVLYVIYVLKLYSAVF